MLDIAVVTCLNSFCKEVSYLTISWKVVQTCASCNKPVGATCVAKCNSCAAISCR